MALDAGFEAQKNVIYSEEVDFKKALDLSHLRGKTALITGGASGLGAATAEFWAQHGANIIIGDINTSLGLQFIASLRAATNNDNHHFLECDVTKWQSQATLFKEAAKASPHGGIDIVIANAGIGDSAEGARFEEPPDYSKMDNPPDPMITRTIDVNLIGVYYTTHLALSYLSRNPGSRPCSVSSAPVVRDRQLILVSSMAGLLPLPRLASYCSAKHGVNGLFRALRLTAPIQHGVRINMINPYFVKTPIIDAGGDIALAGGSLAKIEDVVNVLTRFAVDQGIIGRGCVVGPKACDEDTALTKLPHGGPVWDVHAHDFEQSDVFTRRVIGITNLQTQARGWIGMYRDLFMALASPMLKMVTG